MSQVKVNTIQLGQNADSTKNFVIKQPNDGSLIIARGNIGAELGNLLKINADGGVNNYGPAFFAGLTSAQSINNSAAAKVLFNTESFDTNNCYDPATGRFTPNVAGYYLVSASVRDGGAATTGIIQIQMMKNGTVLATGTTPNIAAQSSAASSLLVLMNGTTDYLEAFAYQTSGSAMNLSTSSNNTYFQGHLVRAA